MAEHVAWTVLVCVLVFQCVLMISFVSVTVFLAEAEAASATTAAAMKVRDILSTRCKRETEELLSDGGLDQEKAGKDI